MSSSYRARVEVAPGLWARLTLRHYRRLEELAEQRGLASVSDAAKQALAEALGVGLEALGSQVKKLAERRGLTITGVVAYILERYFYSRQAKNLTPL